jgi:hypothetical protein
LPKARVPAVMLSASVTVPPVPSNVAESGVVLLQIAWS